MTDPTTIAIEALTKARERVIHGSFVDAVQGLSAALRQLEPAPKPSYVWRVKPGSKLAHALGVIRADGIESLTRRTVCNVTGTGGVSWHEWTGERLCKSCRKALHQ